MRVTGTYYRAHDPRWSWSPLSGEGSAIHGGRWNAKGVSALYLGQNLDGVINEVSQGFARRFEPMTLVSYEVDCEDIADLTSGRQLRDLSIAPDDMRTEWFAIASEDREPPTWRISNELIGKGYAGILVPSFATGAKPDHLNLVLWRWGAELPCQIRVYDPSGKLPNDMSSWERLD